MCIFRLGLSASSGQNKRRPDRLFLLSTKHSALFIQSCVFIRGHTLLVSHQVRRSVLASVLFLYCRSLKTFLHVIFITLSTTNSENASPRAWEGTAAL